MTIIYCYENFFLCDAIYCTPVVVSKDNLFLKAGVWLEQWACNVMDNKYVKSSYQT